MVFWTDCGGVSNIYLRPIGTMVRHSSFFHDYLQSRRLSGFVDSPTTIFGSRRILWLSSALLRRMRLELCS
jgi:hypothetical protein